MTNKKDDLSFYGNWRRMLITTSQSSRDPEAPVEYVVLNEKKLPGKIATFCEAHWQDLAFDFDPQSKLLWPLDDHVTAAALKDALNSAFPGSAKIIKKSPAEAHNLCLTADDDPMWENRFAELQPRENPIENDEV